MRNDEECVKMKVIIEGTPNEIAALVVAVQGQHEDECDADDVLKEISRRLRELPGQAPQAFSL